MYTSRKLFVRRSRLLNRNCWMLFLIILFNSLAHFQNTEALNKMNIITNKEKAGKQKQSNNMLQKYRITGNLFDMPPFVSSHAFSLEPFAGQFLFRGNVKAHCLYPLSSQNTFCGCFIDGIQKLCCAFIVCLFSKCKSK